MSFHRRPGKKLCTGPDKVHVIVRIRPETESERAMACPQLPALSIENESIEGMVFDKIFGVSSLQQELFADSIMPTVDSWVEGYNGCIFAYGQTGSGKTYTMLGPEGGKKKLDGVIPLAVDYALERIGQEEVEIAQLSNYPSQFRIEASYIEVYNDEIRDLLGNGKGDKGELRIRENENGLVFVEGATQCCVTTVADVVSLVNQGSAKRATGRTNMNEHSSRSHAIVGLHLEHRWKDEQCTKNENQNLFKKKVATLHLVDLAGSEYAKKTGNVGQQLKESISINTGLFCLGNVISALAGHRERRVGDHIPYRDSALTRLLQSSLGGDSRTVMIACISPASYNREETISTLKYAASARSITNRATLHIEQFEEQSSPLANDIEDIEQDLDRRTMWLDTNGHGEIFCRCVGDENNELVLLVHGSGPTNSSTWWNGLMYELALKSSQPLYLVALDCPGYGRSKGDRQIIRSYPGAFLSDVVASLGKTDALCLVGSSQGACAVFNACLECPRLARHIAVMDPVGHDVFRYQALTQPCLLIFDTDDEGHPVKVGRWMRDNIKDCIYCEFSSAKEPFWHCDHMADEVLRLLGRPKHRAARFADAATNAVSAMTRLAGGLISWVENMGFGEPIKQIESGLLAPPSTFLRDCMGNDMFRQLTVTSDTTSSFGGKEPTGLQWRAEVDQKSGRVYYVCDDTLEVVWKRPKHGTIEGVSVQSQTASTVQKEELFREPGFEAKNAAETEEEVAQRLELEKQETTCLLCQDLLWEPKRMKKCRHVVCVLCYNASAKYTKRCPICGVEKVSVEECLEHQNILMSHPRAAYKIQLVNAANAREDASIRLILEYGNTAVGSIGAAFAVEAFCRVVKVERGASVKRAIDPHRVLVRVDFNINPDYPKSAVKVTSPPFILQRTMALAFTCEMTAYFHEQSGIPPIVIPYCIHHVPLQLEKLILVLPGVALESRGKIKPITVDHANGILVNLF